MSRLLGKCRGGPTIPIIDEDNSDKEFEPTYVSKRKQKNKNNFAELAKLQSTSDGEGDSVQNSEDSPVTSEDETQKPVDKSQKKKKKKRKNKSQPFNKNENNINLKELDEVDRSVHEVNELLGEPKPSTSAEENKKPHPALNVRREYLNPKRELVKMFGSKTVMDEMPRSERNHWTTYTKSLVDPKKIWEAAKNPGLSMSIQNQEGDIIYFTFNHNANYQKMEKIFINMSRRAMYQVPAQDNLGHIAHLLKLSEIFASQEPDLAEECLDRAIYRMEMAFHPRFSYHSRTCRLLYSIRENRPFHIALLKRVKRLANMACHRTAIEVAKISLNMDDTDPVAMLLIIDIEALKAQEFEWYIEAVDLWDESRHAKTLLNVHFTYVLCHFFLFTKKGGADYEETSNTLLQKALCIFPIFVNQLNKERIVRLDDRTQNHKLFNEFATTTSPGPLVELARIYMNRSKQFWQERKVVEWLQRNALVTIEKFEAGDVDFAHYAECRSCYRYAPDAILRHFSILGEVPGALLEGRGIVGDQLVMDPFPPVDGINRYGYQSINTPREVWPAVQATGRNVNTALTFLQSLNPSFGMNRAVEMEANQLVAELGEVELEDVQDEEVALGGALTRLGEELQHAAEQLAEAMRRVIAISNQDDDPPNDPDSEEE